jgi:hypothetical protein
MTTDAIAALRELESETTPGTWRVEEDAEYVVVQTGLDVEDYITIGAPNAQNRADAALIAAMRNALPALLDVAEAAQRMLIELRAREPHDSACDRIIGCVCGLEAVIDDGIAALDRLHASVGQEER